MKKVTCERNNKYESDGVAEADRGLVSSSEIAGSILLILSDVWWFCVETLGS